MNYTLINTEDGYNPGDSLLTENAKQILNNVFNGKCKYEIPFTVKAEDCLDRINATDICFISTISYTTYDIDTYYDLITKIRVPIVALSSTLALQRFELTRSYKLKKKQKEIIEIVNKYSGIIPVRDIFTKHILNKNGICNVKLVGDLGLFNYGYPIQNMKQPKEIKKILITPPHQKVYNEQLIEVIQYLRKRFPNAEFTYSTHTTFDKAIDFSKTKLEKLNINTVETSGSFRKLDFYNTFDLHVGYRLHGHIKSLSVGIPSILISEDSRGLGQKYSLNNIGIFIGFEFNSKYKFAPKKITHKNIIERIFSIKYSYKYTYKNIAERIFSIKYSCSESKFIITILGIKITKHVYKEYIKSPKKLIEEIDNEISTHMYTNWFFYTIMPSTINNFYKNDFLPFLKNAIDSIKEEHKC